MGGEYRSRTHATEMGRPLSWAAESIAWLTGCSDGRSADAASVRRASSSIPAATTSVTAGAESSPGGSLKVCSLFLGRAPHMGFLVCPAAG